MTQTPRFPFALLLSSLAACTVTSHPSQPAELGRAARSSELLNVIDQPGPIQVETIVASDWEIDRGGLVNLDHPRARAAGLEDGDEPIQIYLHVLTHPTRGTFLVDSGVEDAHRDAPDKAVLRGLAARVMHAEKLQVQAPLGSFLAGRGVQLAGVLLTHLHVDHVMGLPDVPRGTPLYVGPGEVQTRAFAHVLMQPLIDDYLSGHAPLRELRFAADADGRFSGVLDLFGDGSLWALHMPGHTAGSVAYLARTQDGPVLFAGDTCHTAWGWQHDVEPGFFTRDHEANVRSLAQLRQLAREHPTMQVRLGHQPLAQRDP